MMARVTTHVPIPMWSTPHLRENAGPCEETNASGRPAASPTCGHDPFGEAPGGDEGPRQPAAELAQRPRPRHRAPPTARAEPRRAVLDLRPEGRAGGRERHVPVEDPAPGE